MSIFETRIFFVWGLLKWKFLPRKSRKSPREKIGKNDFPPEKYSSYATGRHKTYFYH